MITACIKKSVRHNVVKNRGEKNEYKNGTWLIKTVHMKSNEFKYTIL